ncbi:MAG: hypothetical protein ACRDRG_09700 [Pseudonocardiaceae bacterium]
MQHRYGRLREAVPAACAAAGVAILPWRPPGALHAAMAEVRRGRTTLLIAHRLSTIR